MRQLFRPIWRAATIFTRYSTASLISPFCILAANISFISSIGLMQSKSPALFFSSMFSCLFHLREFLTQNASGNHNNSVDCSFNLSVLLTENTTTMVTIPTGAWPKPSFESHVFLDVGRLKGQLHPLKG